MNEGTNKAAVGEQMDLLDTAEALIQEKPDLSGIGVGEEPATQEIVDMPNESKGFEELKIKTDEFGRIIEPSSTVASEVRVPAHAEEETKAEAEEPANPPAQEVKGMAIENGISGDGKYIEKVNVPEQIKAVVGIGKSRVYLYFWDDKERAVTDREWVEGIRERVERTIQGKEEREVAVVTSQNTPANGGNHQPVSLADIHNAKQIAAKYKEAYESQSKALEDLKEKFRVLGEGMKKAVETIKEKDSQIEAMNNRYKEVIDEKAKAIKELTERLNREESGNGEGKKEDEKPVGEMIVGEGTKKEDNCSFGLLHVLDEIAKYGKKVSGDEQNIPISKGTLKDWFREIRDCSTKCAKCSSESYEACKKRAKDQAAAEERQRLEANLKEVHPFNVPFGGVCERCVYWHSANCQKPMNKAKQKASCYTMKVSNGQRLVLEQAMRESADGMIRMVEGRKPGNTTTLVDENGEATITEFDDRGNEVKQTSLEEGEW